MTVLKIDPNNALSFSAFGAQNDRFGGMTATSILAGDRYQEIDRKQSYYDCTQHDSKTWDFDGRPISPRSQQPLLGAERSFWVPLKMRRPSMTYRLGKIIVDSFTALIFGENRFPSIKVEGDEQTEDLLQTLVRIGKLPLKMIRARTLGGATGSVGVSWCFRKGRPSFEVHNAKALFVHKWKDRVDMIPEHVSEVYLFSKVKWDGRAFNRQWFWFRRDWTPEADIVFKDAPYEPGPDKEICWEVDIKKSNFHGDGVCHLEWIQNLPSDEMDGRSDYEGLFESFDALDLLHSVINRGATLNLDPTVKLKMDRDEIGMMGIAKGSDNALVVGKDGDADYLELGGQSIEAGIKLVENIRRTILETAQCVVPDPHEVAAQGTSSVAMKMMYAPMLAKADIIREQYGTALERMLNNMVSVLREKMGAEVKIQNESGEEEDAKFVLDLPDRIDQEPELDVVDLTETGEKVPVRTPRAPGPGGEITLAWPPYFQPTPSDQASIATSLQTMTGGKPVISQETASEHAARAYGVEPAQEWKRLQAEMKADQEKQSSMMDMGAAGGQVGGMNHLPPGAAPRGGPPHGPPPPHGGPPPHPPNAGGGDPKDPDQDPFDVDLTGK